MKTIEQEPVINLYLNLEQVNLDKIPVMSRDRCLPRKEQAKLARNLFKKLGIKGISVTTPNYSMAQSVDVSIPSLKCSEEDYAGDPHGSYMDMKPNTPARIKHELFWEARQQVGKILNKAFPSHDDRSDSMTDYFDYCWSIS